MELNPARKIKRSVNIAEDILSRNISLLNLRKVVLVPFCFFLGLWGQDLWHSSVIKLSLPYNDALNVIVHTQQKEITKKVLQRPDPTTRPLRGLFIFLWCLLYLKPSTQTTLPKITHLVLGAVLCSIVPRSEQLSLYQPSMGLQNAQYAHGRTNSLYFFIRKSA